MKKLVLVLAMMTALVGVAVAGTITYHYKDCGHNRTANTNGNDGYQRLPGKCPSCQKKQEEESKRKTENVCNVLKGADYDAYSRTPDCNQ